MRVHCQRVVAMFIVLDILLLILKCIYYNTEALFRLFVPATAKNVRGKTVLVTGAGRGIGRELAYKFAEKGAKIAVWDVNKDGVEETANEITERGGFARPYVCDVTNTDSVKTKAKEVKREFGGVDILVNNAGIMNCKAIMDLEEKDIRRTMEINTISHFWTVREFLPAMMDNNDGHIVTIASMAGKAGTPYLTDYSASKFGAYGFTESLAAELRLKKKHGIKTSTVCPMFVNTHLITGLEHRTRMRNRFGAMMEPSMVADGIVEGVLRNDTHIYIPKHMQMTDVLAPFPVKTKLAIGAFLDARFEDVNEK